ncbi:MAG TPA: bifunctional riboflavin kinase/FAD synthetase [Actinomycetota bacterium]
MEIRRGVASLPIDDGPTVVTVGFFDGVHLGHRAVIEQTVQAARERSARAVAVTFDRHPREILTPGKEPRLLTTVDRKAELIAATGADVLLILGFTEAFSRWTAEAFVRTVLVNGLHAVHVAVGGDFTFGHRAAGTLQTLHELGASLGFTAEEVAPFELDGRRLSSSSIREALSAGDLEWPTRALGRRYSVDGTVVSGAGRGHGLGFPTANLRTSPRLLLPGTGIYAGRAGSARGEYVAAVSVGTNPTFGVEPLHVEAYLLDFGDGDLRGQDLTVEFWERLRDEERFGSTEDLIRAMEDDVRRTRGIVPPVGG